MASLLHAPRFTQAKAIASWHAPTTWAVADGPEGLFYVAKLQACRVSLNLVVRMKIVNLNLEYIVISCIIIVIIKIITIIIIITIIMH